MSRVGSDRNALLVQLTVAIAVLVFLFAQLELWNSYWWSRGDEPSIVMAVISMVKRHTFNVYPGYIAGDFRTFGLNDLHWQVPPVNGFIPPEHGIGFAAFVAPLYAALGLSGTRIALIAINALVFPLLFLNCVWSGLSRLSAALACLALATVMPWEVYIAILVPEALAGTMTMGIVAAYLRFKQTGHWAYAFGVGLITVLLPIIYLKYAALAVASGVFLLADRKLRMNPATYVSAALAGAYAFVWVATTVTVSRSAPAGALNTSIPLGFIVNSGLPLSTARTASGCGHP